MTAKEIDNLPIEELQMLAESLTLEERDCWSHNGYDGETYVYIMQTRKG